MRKTLILLAVLFAGASIAEPLHEVRPPSGGWVRDLTGTLSGSTISTVNEIAGAVDAEGVGQLGVAIVRDTDGQNPRRYATDLFNRWGIGDRARNDGVLLLIAIEDRKAEIILGRGIDSDASVAATDRIMTELVVAHMKQGRPEAAVTESVRALASFLRTGPQPHKTGAPLAGFDDSSADISAPPSEENTEVLLFGATAVGLAGGGFGLRSYLRNRTRKCKSCGLARMRLDEVADDAHLDAGQKAEERFKSVDYDVWWCVPCEDALVIPWGRFFSGRVRCQACRYKTARTSSRTLVHATYDHGGEVEVTETCGHCSHVRTYRRYTPKKTRSSSSSSGSFGGGSSGGRGSSGSW